MESIDLSLIEIGGADDSLLDDLIGDECNIRNSNRSDLLRHEIDKGGVQFACSPLQALGSKRSSVPPVVPAIEILSGNAEVSSSGEEVDNKENLNVKNLSAEKSSQEAKRRKKGGGYNLRKSLAWNSAFFTEEGVLDPLELSRLSNRSIRESGAEFLSSISEETSVPLPKRLDGSAEKKLFNKSHSKSSNEGRKAGSALLCKAESPAQKDAGSVASGSQKVQIARSNSRSASHGGGCPRPSGSSSQKRLPSSIVLSAPVRDKKLPKFPVLKSASSSASTTSKNVVPSAKRSSCNRNPPCNPPSVNDQKSVGVKGTRDPKFSPRRTSSSAKSSVFCPAKNMGNSSLAAPQSTNSKLSQASKCNALRTKITLNPVLPADTPAPSVDTGSNKVVDSLIPNTNYIGESIQNTKSQSAKPSGLRMPSPSLGYFDQKKALASPIVHSPRDTQSCNLGEYNKPTPQKLNNPKRISETTRATAGTVRLPREGTDFTKSRTVASGSSSKYATPSIATTASHLAMKSNFELNNLQIELKSDFNPSSSHNQTLSQQGSQAIRDDFVELDGKHTEVKNPTHDEFDCISHDENRRLEMNGDESLVQSGSSAQAQRDDHLESIIDVHTQGISSNGNESGFLHAEHQVNSEMEVKVTAGADNLVEHQNREDTKIDSSLIDDQGITSSRDSEDFPSVKNTLAEHDDSLEGCHNVSRQLAQADIRKPRPHDVDETRHEHEVSHAPSQVNTEMLDSGEDYTTEHRPGGGIQMGFLISNLLVNNNDAASGSLFRDAIDHVGPDTLVLDSNCLTAACGTDRQSGQQAELGNPPDETVKVLFEDKHEEKNKSSPVKQNKPVGGSWKDIDLGNLIVSPLDREARGRVKQSSDVSALTSSSMQMKEGANRDCSMMNGTKLESSQVKHLDRNLLVENHYFTFHKQLIDDVNSSNPHSCLRDGDDVDEQAGKKPEPRKTCADEVLQIPSKCDPGLQMHDNTLLKKSRSSEDSQKDNGKLLLIERGTAVQLPIDNNLENAISFSSERDDSSGAGVDKTVLHPHGKDMSLGSLSINLSIENQESIHGSLTRYSLSENSRSESPLRSGKDLVAADLTTCNLASVCSLNDGLGLSDNKTSNIAKPQGEEDNGSEEDNVLSNYTESDLSLSCKNSNDELQSEIENGVLPMDDNSSKMIHKRKSLDDLKPDARELKHKLNAVSVPFSDEWLAALEAAGEDILTMKSGAVQHSPTEKSLPEPNPWSPVKRKNNQEIGPFDCTKYTNPSQPQV